MIAATQLTISLLHKQKNEWDSGMAINSIKSAKPGSMVQCKVLQDLDLHWVMRSCNPSVDVWTYFIYQSGQRHSGTADELIRMQIACDTRDKKI